MGVLSAFLHPVEVDETKKVIISKRFLDEDGNPVPFEIKPMSQEENQRLTKKFTRGKYVNGNKVDVFDSKAYTNAMIVACTVQPDFADSEMCKAYGCIDPEAVPARMLRAGEYTALVQEIMQFNGFDPDSKLKEEEEAKN